MDSINNLIRKKWFLLTVILTVILFLLIAMSFSKPKINTLSENQPQPDQVSPVDDIDSNAPTVAPTAFTPEQLKNIEEQRKIDEIVGKREIEIKTKYPWFIKLPLRGQKYFVYFDQNQSTFVGLLYPKSGDNVEDMKAEVIAKLRQEIQITDVEKYPFEWKITPE